MNHFSSGILHFSTSLNFQVKKISYFKKLIGVLQYSALISFLFLFFSQISLLQLFETGLNNLEIDKSSILEHIISLEVRGEMVPIAPAACVFFVICLGNSYIFVICENLKSLTRI